jgi:hypothetical protein
VYERLELQRVRLRGGRDSCSSSPPGSAHLRRVDGTLLCGRTCYADAEFEIVAIGVDARLCKRCETEQKIRGLLWRDEIVIVVEFTTPEQPWEGLAWPDDESPASSLTSSPSRGETSRRSRGATRGRG